MTTANADIVAGAILELVEAGAAAEEVKRFVNLRDHQRAVPALGAHRDEV